MHSTPRFLQGVFAFEGRGIDQPFPIGGAASYTVPDGVTAQPVYFRGGNTTAELVYLEHYSKPSRWNASRQSVTS